MNKKELKRNMEIEETREKRRKRRKRIVFAEKCIILLVIIGLLVSGGIISYNMQPEVKLEKQLKEAEELMETADYAGAIASCEEALKIDSTSVKAYTSMAGAYLTQEDTASAEKILYRGWEATHDESLLQYYCTVLLNEGVAEINAGNCSYATLEKCLTVLEKDPDNTDVYELMDACYERLLVQSENAGFEGFFCEAEAGCGYGEYQEFMQKLLAAYQAAPNENLKSQVLQYAVPDYEQLWLTQEHLQSYEKLLAQADGIVKEEGLSSLYACVKEAIQMQTFFSEAFTVFESGEFEPIKEFMQKEEYISIRDGFLAGTMEYWDGKTYIPVTREKIKFMLTDGKWKYAFPDYEEYPEALGMIKVWGAKQEDDGVQRLCISYEPALTNGEYYPHTTYEFIYLYSNVRIRGVDVPQMNYRFETRIATPEETTTQVIGDWGGEHEFNMEF